MSVHEEFPDVLQNIEATVLDIYRRNNSIIDLHVIDAYDAAAKKVFRAQSGQVYALPGNVDERVRHIYEAVIETCNVRMGFDHSTEPKLPEDLCVTATDIVACLKKLKSSATYWNKQGGRQGYLQYINNFV